MAGADGASDATRAAAASALSNVACNCDQTQRAMLEGGALPVVAELLLPDAGCSGACREAAAWALSNLACCPDVRKLLRCAAGAQGTARCTVFARACLQLLPVGRRPAARSGRCHPCTHAAFTAPPATCSEEQAVLDGAVGGLLELLRSGGDSGGQAAARAIKNLSAGSGSAAKARAGRGAWRGRRLLALPACMTVGAPKLPACGS